MTQRRISTILDATVSGFQAGMRAASRAALGTAGDIDDLSAKVKDVDGLKASPEVTADIAAASGDIDKVGSELRQLDSAEAEVRAVADVVSARSDLDRVGSDAKQLDGMSPKIRPTVDPSKVDSGLRKVTQGADQAGQDGGKAMSSNLVAALVAIPIAGVFIGLGIAAVAAFVGAIKSGMQVELREDLFSARTGLDAETSKKFGRAAGEAYASAWGDSIAGNLDAARLALQEGLIDADAEQAEIEKIVASLTGLGSLMEEDIPRIAATAGTLVRSGFSDNVQSAFDTLTVGFQNGVNKGDDLLDTMTEYPAVLQKLGLSADEAMGLLNQGLEAGARNSDFVADALKEFQIRATDASTLSAQGYELIGLSAESMTDKIARGGEGAKEGLQQVLDGLRAMEDPVARNTAGVALFGTKWEDLGDSLLALDVSTAVDSLGGIEAVAGAADRALTTMADNSATQVESAKRNIEVAADGIKGALAAAFADDADAAAKWVQRNRAPVMEFLANVVRGALDAGRGFIEFGASALDAMGTILVAAADVFLAIDKLTPGDQHGQAFKDWALDVQESMGGTADTMRTYWVGALDEVEQKFDTFIEPEILAARVHDAQLRMSEDMDIFAKKVDDAGGTIEINGETYTAEEALALLVDNVNAEDGTVTINGDKVPAEDALDRLMDEVGKSEEDVTVGANTVSGESGVVRLLRWSSEQHALVPVDAETWQAERDLAYAARNRNSTIYATVRVNNDGLYSWAAGAMSGIHDGGWVSRAPGLAAGGWVPGSDPGYDNILWPLNDGGQVLAQPLAGDEFVVNSKDAAYWAPWLEWMNGGGRPSDVTTSSASPGHTYNLALTIDARDLEGIRSVEEFQRNARRWARQAGGR